MPTRSLILLLAATAVVPCLPAQHLPLRIAGVAGLNRTSATGVGSIEAQLGGTAGVSATIEFSRLLGLRTEALLSRRVLRGFDPAGPPACALEDLCLQVPEDREETRLTDLEFPLLLEVRAAEGSGRVRPFAYAGPFMALRLGCSRATDAGTGGTLVRSCGVNPQESGALPYYSDVDGGLVVGGGVRLGMMGIGLRWTRGYVPIVPFQPAGFEQLMNGKSSSLALLVELGARVGR